MAGTPRRVQPQGGAEPTEMPDAIRIEYNRLVADLERVRAALAATLTKLDADAGVTDTNYASTQAANVGTAAVLTAAQLLARD